MKKKQGFFSGLKKSTVITMVSCISFVVMTFLALLFFVKFPVRPSERIISSMGRQSIYKQNVSPSELTAVPQTTTTTATESATVQTTTARTTHKEFIITITTGRGFGNSEFKGHDVYVEDYDYEDYADYNYDDIIITTTTSASYDDYDYSYDYDYDYQGGYSYDDDYSGYDYGNE